MSSHRFDEVESTCDRIAILRDGRLAAIESISALRAAQRKVYAVTFADEGEARRFCQAGFEIVSAVGSKLEVALHANLGVFLAALPGYQVTGLDTVQQSLEDIFMQYFGGAGGTGV